MLTLQTIAPTFGLRNPSLFCLKAETLLRLAGLEYQRVDARPDKAPKGKLPVLVDGDVLVPDSAHIQAHLEEHHGAGWDDGLSSAQRAEAHAYRSLVEDRLYWAVGHALWVEHADQFRDGAFAEVPSLIRRLVFGSLQRKTKRDLHGQGFGRHSRDEIYDFGLADLRALEVRLAEGPFFFGARPRSIDASIYGVLHLLVRGPFDNPLSAFARQSKVLREYEARVDEAAFGDAAAELAAE